MQKYALYANRNPPLKFSKHAETVFFVHYTSRQVCKKNMHLHKNHSSTYEHRSLENRNAELILTKNKIFENF